MAKDEATDEELRDEAWRNRRGHDCDAVMVAEIPGTDTRVGHLCDAKGTPHKAHGCGDGYIWWKGPEHSMVQWKAPATQQLKRRPRFYGQTGPYGGPPAPDLAPKDGAWGPHDAAHAANSGPGWPVDPVE